MYVIYINGRCIKKHQYYIQNIQYKSKILFFLKLYMLFEKCNVNVI